jgi:hypothetical protein
MGTEIKIYDEPLLEKVITVPAKVERPSFRIIIDTPMKRKGDIIEVITTINKIQVSKPMQFVVSGDPISGNDIVAVVSLSICEQPSAILPSVDDQIKDKWVCMSPEEKEAYKEKQQAEVVKS